MKKWVKWVLSIALALGLVFLSFAVLAKEGEKTVRQTKIEGYGEYKLGMPVSELPLDELVGPVRDAYYETLGAMNYGKEEKVHLAGRGTDVLLVILTLKGKVERVMLEFTGLLEEFRELDSVGRYVKDLRQLVIDKYDLKLKKKDFFSYDYSGISWSGLLELEDESGNTLSLLWKEYSLFLSYESARLRKMKKEAEKKAQNRLEEQI